MRLLIWCTVIGMALCSQIMAAGLCAETHHVWEKVEINSRKPPAIRESIHGRASLGGSQGAGLREAVLRILGRR